MKTLSCTFLNQVPSLEERSRAQLAVPRVNMQEQRNLSLLAVDDDAEGRFRAHATAHWTKNVSRYPNTDFTGMC